VATAHPCKKRVHASQVIPHTNEETQVERRSKRLKPPPDPTHVGPTPVDAANTNPHIPQPPVANPVTQEQLAAEPVPAAGSQQELAPALDGQGQEVLVPVSQTLPAQQQQDSDDLPPTASPGRGNCFPEDEPRTQNGTCSKAYSCMIPYIYLDSLM